MIAWKIFHLSTLFGSADIVAYINGDQLIILFIGFLFFGAGIGMLFVSVDERAEKRDKKRDLVAPDLPRTHLFSPYFLFQVPGFKWLTASFFLILSGMFLSHAFGLLDGFL